MGNNRRVLLKKHPSTERSPRSGVSAGKQYRGKLADPEWRRERARKARAAQTPLDHHVNKIVESAPALTPEQCDRLATLLGFCRDGSTSGEVKLSREDEAAA
jgi:hypothetical protein